MRAIPYPLKKGPVRLSRLATAPEKKIGMVAWEPVRGCPLKAMWVGWVPRWSWWRPEGLGLWVRKV